MFFRLGSKSGKAVPPAGQALEAIHSQFDFCPFFEDQAAGASAWSSRQRKGCVSFSKASRCPGIAKTHSTHSQRLTAVMASENVTSCFPAQSTARTPA